MQIWASSTTVEIITLLLVSVGHLDGHVALFTGCIALFTGSVALFTGHIAGLLVWLTY